MAFAQAESRPCRDACPPVQAPPGHGDDKENLPKSRAGGRRPTQLRPRSARCKGGARLGAASHRRVPLRDITHLYYRAREAITLGSHQSQGHVSCVDGMQVLMTEEMGSDHLAVTGRERTPSTRLGKGRRVARL
eukprot:evm.model.scf_1868.1 EVM.evm.TU.scf_1868.1   scf_1868:14302-16359(-)